MSILFVSYTFTNEYSFDWVASPPVHADFDFETPCTEITQESCPMDQEIHNTPCIAHIDVNFTKVADFDESAVESYFKATNNGTDKTLMFMHIPKTAGTSIEISGLEHNILWGAKLFNSETFASIFGTEMHAMCETEFHRKRCCGAPWHVPLRFWIEYFHEKPQGHHHIEKFFDLNTVDYFCVVRNPFDRMISEYKYLLHLSQKHRFKPQRLFKEHGIDIGNGFDIKDKTEEFVCTEFALNQWVQIALGDYVQIRCDEPDMMETHFYPQYESVFDSQCRQICPNVVRFEHLDGDMKELLERYNLHGVYQTLAKTHETKLAVCEEYGLGVQNLTEVSKALIYHRYRQDFQAFGYHGG